MMKINIFYYIINLTMDNLTITYKIKEEDFTPSLELSETTRSISPYNENIKKIMRYNRDLFNVVNYLYSK